jgi:hypothetical protein
VTHPPGRKVCVHCGGRVQPGREAVFDPRAALEARLGLPTAAGEPEPAEEDETSGRVRGARLGMTLVWVLLAVSRP